MSFITAPFVSVTVPVLTLPPLMLPLALIKPVTYSPVAANVATFVPATPTVTLPLAAATTFDVPFTIELGVPPLMPESKAPLPRT